MGRKILDQERQKSGNNDIINSAITSSMETALHVAAGANQAEFVEMLINDKDNIDLTFQDVHGNTAFCSAVAAGSKRIVQKFLTLTHLLPTDYCFIKTRGGQNMSPLYIASWFGQPQIVSLLYQDSIDKANIEDGEILGIYFNCIHNDMYDLAIKMIEDNVDNFRLGIAHCWDTTDESALHVLSRKRPLDFTSSPQAKTIWSRVWSRISCQSPSEMPALTLAKIIWKQVLEKHGYQYNEIRRIIKHPFNLVIEAANNGNFDLLVVLIRMCPELIWERDDENNTIFHIAILNRHVKIFRLIHEVGVLKSVIRIEAGNNSNNILHLVARKPQQSKLDSIIGAALQMRHELLWYKEVEKIVAPSLRNKKNDENQTPNDIFTKDHEQMMSDAEKWMKKNCNTCLIVATIIVTVAFPAAFDILDQGDKDKHNVSSVSQLPPPRDIISIILLISNAVAMSFSSIAIMLFLSIMISRFTKNEFLWTLPCTFITGLSLLFVSVTAMMVSFCFASFIPNESLRIPIFSSCIELLPIILFFYLVYPVFRDTIHSTFFSQNEFKATNRLLKHYEK
ncbi:uncharacterized protein LOC133824750 [Humulus lupulus]|uniref:uncharacterized protein LOC133824750 n=1 Tax=Humulus lupulus TaxID=3486 RepID=UPI002B40BBA9|nr:uncharacterized protein LOC133824750 [Humulus lupulus]